MQDRCTGTFRLPSDLLSDKPTKELSGQISIAEIGMRFLQDFELSTNSDCPYSDYPGPTCVFCFVKINEWWSDQNSFGFNCVLSIPLSGSVSV